jgi:hypothetical protein
LAAAYSATTKCVKLIVFQLVGITLLLLYANSTNAAVNLLPFHRYGKIIIVCYPNTGNRLAHNPSIEVLPYITSFPKYKPF